MLPPTVIIDWSAPSGCPDTSQVRAAIEAMVGASLGRADARFAARALVTETASGRFALRIEIESTGASETKLIDAQTCAMAADAYAVVVGFALDPSVGGVPPAPTMTDARAVSASTPGRPPERPQAIVATTPVAHAGIHAIAGPLVALGVGALPFPAYGLGAKVALERTWRWEVAGMYWPERSTTIPVGSSAAAVGARVRLESLQSSLCLVHGAGAWCVAGEVGAMSASGTGIPMPGQGTSWWLAPSLAAAARLTVWPRVALGIRLDFGVAIFRPSFFLDRVNPSDVLAYQPAPVFATVRLEPEFDFFSTGSSEIRHVHR